MPIRSGLQAQSDAERNSIKPARQGPGAANRVTFTHQRNKGRLQRVLGILAMALLNPPATGPVRRDALSDITTLPGWFSRAQLVERYARLTGREVSGLGYYEVFGIFKIAVVLQQIYFRYHRGQTRDARFQNFDERVRGLVQIAAGLAEKSG